MRTFFNGRERLGELLKERRKKTAERFAEFQAQLSEAKTLCETEACVYATGSFARGEASDHSDLDLFIVAKGKADGKDRGLSKLNEIIVKADLIQATRELNLPEFSGDGEYLTCHTIKELTGTLGGPKDDVTNTFTARLLLLLRKQATRRRTRLQQIHRGCGYRVLARLRGSQE